MSDKTFSMFSRTSLLENLITEKPKCSSFSVRCSSIIICSYSE